MEARINSFIKKEIDKGRQAYVVCPLVEENEELDLKAAKTLYEEYKEVIEASGSDRIEELADMLEIINALAKIESKTLDNVILVAEQKNEKRGAFNEKIFLEKVIESNK
jgi:predicted house-cleaning noncanonical NTP pyrophosphatase (MazG superfamily)